jgi:hypothetical protein
VGKAYPICVMLNRTSSALSAEDSSVGLFL